MQHARELWRKATAGDEASFEKLFHGFYTPLLRYGLRFGYDVSFVEEAIQELFIKIWKNRETLAQPDSVKSYLLKSVRHVIFNKLNTRKKELFIGSLEDFLEFDLSYDPLEARGELSEEMQRMLNQLTVRQKEAVYLYFFEDLSYQEIADLLRIEIGGTYKLIYRALDQLRALATTRSDP